MPLLRSRLPALLIVFLGAAISTADSKGSPAQVEFFESKIRPVLVKHCFKCHSGKAKKGGLLLDSAPAIRQGGDSGTALVAGKPGESLLIAALKYEGPEMPPKGKLPVSVVKDFEHWIREGGIDPRTAKPAVTADRTIDYAAAGKFWAFQPPRATAVPKGGDTWACNDVDRFVFDRLLRQRLSPSPPASARRLARRLYLDVIGLPPSPKEVAQFVSAHTADPRRAVEQLVSHLLDNASYGERWARHWLDVARYGEDQAHTFKARRYPRGYLYRDWVINAFNSDMPYNEFLTAQIAGDLIPRPDRHKRVAALGLFALGPVYYAENVEKAKAAADEWDDRVDTLMRGVLGLTASCARCHDHKYDPISMKDYYGIAGVFASSQYQERSTASAETMSQRQSAQGSVNRQQVQIQRFMLDQSRLLRPSLADDIPRYLVAAWKIQNLRKKSKDDKKRFATIAKTEKVSVALLRRWVVFLDQVSKQTKLAEQSGFLQPYLTLLKSQDAKQDLSQDKAAIAAVVEVGSRIRVQVVGKLPRKNELFQEFGESVAFVRGQDRAIVRAGVVPLGNLFDDSSSVSLDAAVATDKNRAVATSKSLGVHKVAYGFGGSTAIAPGVSFDFRKLGSDSRKHGSVTNDGWSTDGAIRTIGKRLGSRTSKRIEQGIGMHANALISFDLDEIRQAGLLPPNQRFVFKVERAGLNDDSFGIGASSAYVVAIVSRPHRNKTETDAILGGYVNGKPVDIGTNDFTYYFSGDVPKPLRADGRYTSFNIVIPAEAKHLTLATLGAGEPQDNSISSDHVVFSGARLEQHPLPKRGIVAAKAENRRSEKSRAKEQDQQDARLLSRFLYDEGLLALSPKESEPRLPANERKRLAEMRQELVRLKKVVADIKIQMAHSLAEAKGRDLPVYLQGNPARHGDVAPRAMPAIFTGGRRQPFSTKGSGRLELAAAIVSPKNPLTARVIVNRIWSHYFGHGIVRTPSNFGQLGERPTHPKLLDHLAVEFVKHGWSLKWLHREILLSATYQQSSRFDAAKYERDPDNRLLWRMNRRRLSIEPWRDSLLAVTGELDQSIGGPSKNLSDNGNTRRTLYGFVSRHKLDELLRLFDFPDPNITADKRTVTTVPLQQLFVLNSEFMMRRARALAKRLQETEKGQDAERVQYAFQLLYGRPPVDDEVQLALRFLAGPQSKQGLTRWEQYALALLSANEFLFLD